MFRINILFFDDSYFSMNDWFSWEGECQVLNIFVNVDQYLTRDGYTQPDVEMVQERTFLFHLEEHVYFIGTKLYISDTGKQWNGELL